MAARLREDEILLATDRSFLADAMLDSAGAAGSDRSFAVHLGPVEQAVRCFRRSPSEQTRLRMDEALAAFKEARRSRALARWRGIDFAARLTVHTRSDADGRGVD